MFALLLIGLAAGTLTTVTGVAGGMVALSLLSLWMQPAEALAISAAAFAVGNGHRMLLYARQVDRRVALRFGAGLALGAAVAAAWITSVPAPLLRLALAVVASLSLARVLWQRRGAAPKPASSSRSLLVAGVLTGAVGAGTGGAGVLVAPLLLAAGLRREAYVATVAACAIVLNSARVFGYGVAGLYHFSMLAQIGALALALIAGNLLGRHVRGRVSGAALDRLELLAPALAIVLTLAGL